MRAAARFGVRGHVRALTAATCRRTPNFASTRERALPNWTRRFCGDLLAQRWLAEPLTQVANNLLD